MNVNQYVIAATSKAADDLTAAVKRVPEDKLTWKPLDNGRSVLHIAQECAHCPLWTVSTIHEFLGTTTELTPYEDASKWTTVEACEEALRKHLVQFNEAVSAFPEDRLQESITIQWGTFSLAAVLSFALWNLNYHVGQVNYIQTLYGDFE